MPDTVMDSATPVLDTDMVLDTTARDPLMPEDQEDTARDPLMLSLKPRLMLDFFMEDMDMVLDSDMPVLDMLDTAMLLPMLVLATVTVLDTMARDPLMPNPKLRLMLD